MREYSLQDPDYRKNVDLTYYKTMIEGAIHSIVPKANVNVYKDHYTIDPDSTKGEVIKIGRILAQPTHLGQYCISRPLLFKGEEIKEKSDETTQKEKSDKEQKDIEKPKKKGRCR